MQSSDRQRFWTQPHASPKASLHGALTVGPSGDLDRSVRCAAGREIREPAPDELASLTSGFRRCANVANRPIADMPISAQARKLVQEGHVSSVVTLLLIAVLIWFAMGASWVLLSGLGRLAATYPDRPEETPAKVYNGYGQLGLANTAPAMLSGGGAGLRIEAARVLIPWGKATFIPWNEIAYERVEPTALGWPSGRVRLRFRRVRGICLTLPSEDLSRLGAPLPEREQPSKSANHP
jgi:hypothetical protein